MNIDLKYKIQLQGYRNKWIIGCLNCQNNLNGKIFQHIKGFADTDYGTMVIVECPECFETFYFHADQTYYDMFLEVVEEGNNIFYRTLEGKKGDKMAIGIKDNGTTTLWKIPLLCYEDEEYNNTWLVDHLRQLANKIEKEKPTIYSIGIKMDINYKVPDLLIEIFPNIKEG